MAAQRRLEFVIPARNMHIFIVLPTMSELKSRITRVYVFKKRCTKFKGNCTKVERENNDEMVRRMAGRI